MLVHRHLALAKAHLPAGPRAPLQGRRIRPSAHLCPPLRLASGLVLLTYLSMHLLTHMTGLASLATAEAGLQLTMRIWQSLPGTVALYGAFALHIALALRTIYLRRHWKLPLIEWVRLWAGFSLPLLLIGHVVATRLAVVRYGYEPTYTKVAAGRWRSARGGTDSTPLQDGPH